MATRGQQKKADVVDEKKLQQAVESWLKKHRAAVQDKKLQSVVDDFVKSHRKEVGDRGMKIIRRVISEGRTAPKTKPLTGAKSSPTMQQAEKAGEGLRTKANTRGPQKPAPKGVSSSIKEATSKANSAVKTASKVGKIARGATSAAGALAYSEKLGGGKDTRSAESTRELAQALGKDLQSKIDANKKKDATERSDRMLAEKAREQSKKSATNSTYKIKKGDTLSEIAQKHGLKTDELAKKNEIADKDKIYAGRTLKLNKGGYANCGASMKPTQKSSKGVK